MCSRVTIRTPLDRLRDLFRFEGDIDLVPRFNVAPSQPLLTVSADASEPTRRKGALVRWGMQRPKGADGKSMPPIINARSETAESLPTFRDAFRIRRCVVLIDGFYEWRQEGRQKQPYLFELNSGAPFALAGLIDAAKAPGCVVLTTDANEVVAPIHDRMPVILPEEEMDVWLDPTRGADDLKRVLRPLPSSAMRRRPVSVRVNDARRDAPDVLGPPEQGSLF